MININKNAKSEIKSKKEKIKMEIKVNGIGEKSFKPDVIKFSFTFNIKRKAYQSCLADGSKNVENYIGYLTGKGFVKDEIKTDRFNVHRERVYNEKTRQYGEGDFVFSFSCELTIKYDLDLMSQIMEETSKMKECPTYRVDFGLKNEKKAIDELMTLAYKNAENQAKVIAKASGKTLKDCVKVSFEPFDDVMTREYAGVDSVMYKSKSASESIQNIFVPKDVELDFTLYTLWIAE